jgi:phage terminase small subunit
MSMAELANRRHEAFALLLAGGACGAEAARQAGYRGRRHRQTAHELLQRPEIRARVEELRREVRTEFDLQALLARYLLLADACQLRDDAPGELAAALDRIAAILLPDGHLWLERTAMLGPRPRRGRARRDAQPPPA